MPKVLIIGATGTVGGAVRKALLSQTDCHITLFSRSAGREKVDSSREAAVSGSVTNDADLDKVIKGQDAVFAALSGDLGKFARHIVDAMKRNGVKRLVFITSMGIYNEIPDSVGSSGNLEHNSILRPYREAADVIEDSDLNYTVVRPGWFKSGFVKYEVTKKGEPFGGHDVTISSIADLVKRLVMDHNLYSRESVGIHTP